MKNKLKKIYGRFTVEIFDDDEALGLKDTVSINENTPERYKKAVKTILTTLSEEYRTKNADEAYLLLTRINAALGESKE